MKEKVTNTAVKPQFIRLNDGGLMNINNIVAISEDDSDVFVLGYKSIPITEEDMAAVLGNIEIIDNDGHQHHCGQDADDACCQARHFNMEGYEQVIIHEGNIPADQEGSFSLKDLLGMQVVCIGKGKCDDCPADNHGDKCVKIEAVGGIYICLAKPQQEEPKRPVISFDDDNEENPADIMARIKEKADDFMDYLDTVIKTDRNE